MLNNESHLNERFSWRPLSLNYLIENFKVGSAKFLLPIAAWVFIIIGCLLLTNRLAPASWLMPTGENVEVINLFILYPVLSIGLLLLFWMGFEWGFIPVFITTFGLAFQSGMGITWAILFGFSFVMSLAIFGLAFHSLQVPHDLRGFKSIAFFISVSFVAALASSMGAFVWSLSHNLSAFNTEIIWKSWWTGLFFQSIFIVAPLLFVFTPTIEKAKIRSYQPPAIEDISLKWIYSTVLTITAVLTIFIFSGELLGKYRLNEVLDNIPNIMRGDVIGALDAFQVIFWLSAGLIIITGFTAMYLVASWNRELQNRVELQTDALTQSNDQLETSLHEKKLLVQETHHRVKNNLAQVNGLLQLQMMMVDDPKYSNLINDASSRVKSMSLIHEALYTAEEFSRISLHTYLKELGNIVHESFQTDDADIELAFQLEPCKVNTDRAIPIGLIANEILINAYKYAFEGKEKGTITLQLEHIDDKVKLEIRDNGVGMPDQTPDNTLGMKLIRQLSTQIDANLSIRSNTNGTSYMLEFVPQA
jgi:two-component sensor histidine kinase